MKTNFVVANLVAEVLGHDCARADVSQCETTIDFIRAQVAASKVYYQQYADSTVSMPGGTGAWTATIYGGQIESPVVTHRTGSGRLEVTLTSEALTLRVNAGVKNDEGGYGCPVVTFRLQGERWAMTQCDPQLVEGREDRLYLLNEVDARLMEAELPSLYVGLDMQSPHLYGRDIVLSAFSYLGDLRDIRLADSSAAYDDRCAAAYAAHQSAGESAS